MKKTPLKKRSKQKISVVQRKLWELCKAITRLTQPNVCYTCGQTRLSGTNLQTGHVPWPKAALGAYLKYDLRLLKIQCARCNLFLGGMGAVAYTKMLKEIGPKEMRKLEADRKVSVQAMDHYLSLIDRYQKLLEELNNHN